MRSVIRPVQPVWWKAPIAAPLSPWKYSLKIRLSFQGRELPGLAAVATASSAPASWITAAIGPAEVKIALARLSAWQSRYYGRERKTTWPGCMPGG
jgi:hypothetical protein